MTEPTWPKPWPSIDESLADAITALDQANVTSASEGDLTNVARRLDTAKRVTAICKEIVTYAEARLACDLTEPLAIAGVGVVVTEHTWGSAWSTRDSGAQFREDFVSAVVREVATDIATREIDPMKRNVARAALTRALQALPAVQALKKDEAKKLGLMMSDYRDYTDGKKVVILPIERNVDEPARSKGNVLGLDGES